MTDSINLLYRLRPESDAVLAKALDAVAAQAWQAVSTQPDQDRAGLWFGLLLTSSTHADNQAQLRRLLGGELGLPGLDLSQDRRWQLVGTLAAAGAPDAEALIREESLRDASDRGRKSALAADAARPLPEVKARWLAELTSPESALGLARQRAVMSSLFPASQADLLAGQLPGVLAALPALAGRDPYFLSSFVAALTGPVCSDDSVAAIGAALDAGGLNSTSELFLREALQADQECLALRAAMTRE